VLVGGQKAWHYTDQVKLDKLKTELATERGSIANAETKLQSLDAEIKRADAEREQLKSGLDLIEVRYPSGIPSEAYDPYKQSVTRYNELVNAHNAIIQNYNTLYAAYSGQVDAYNQKVTQFNTLAKDIGSTWYVIPVPCGRMGAHGTRAHK
jgi:multidrug resistance efflux pump